MVTFCCRKYGCVLITLLLIPFLSLFAQQKNYSLPDLVDTAKNYLPQLMRKKALLSSAQAYVTDTRHSFLPGLKVNDQLDIGTDNSLASSYFPFGIVPSTSSGVNDANNGQGATGNIAILYSQYDLVDFGYRNAKINNAKAYADLQEADLQKELYYIKIQIAKLYFNLLKSQSKLSADAQNIARYENIFTVIHALTKSGIKAGSDSSLAKAELSGTRIGYNQTLGTINQLREQLAYLTGIPAANMNIDTTALQVIKIQSGAFSQVEDTSGNPLIVYYEKLKNIYASNEKLISKSFLPKIVLAATTWARGSSIGYNDDYKSLGTGMGFQRFNYLAGVSFQYDLFNPLHKRDKLNVYRFETMASDLDLQQQKLALHSASLQADNSIKTTEANLLELPVQLNAAQDSYNQEIAQYKAGIINLVDLTNAAYVLYRAVNDYVETISDWYLAQLDKATATGKLDSFIQIIK
jgi:outer membrane protein TolC